MKVTISIGQLSGGAQRAMDSVKKGEKSNFVREAIEFYVANRNAAMGSVLNAKMDYTIERLESLERMLQQGNVFVQDSSNKSDSNDIKNNDELEKQRKMKEAEQQLAASLSNFI